MDSEKRKSKEGIYILVVLVTVLSFFMIRGYFIRASIKNQGKGIVAKFIRKKNYAKSVDYYFGYYYNSEYYENTGNNIRYSGFNSDEENRAVLSLEENHFYYAKFNPKYPDLIDVDASKEITDTTEIKNAGFSLEN